MNMHLEAIAPALQIPSTDGVETHKVLNQARPCVGHNAFTDDIALREIVAGRAPWVIPNATTLGALAGDEQVQELAKLGSRTNTIRSFERMTASAIASTGSSSIRPGISS